MNKKALIMAALFCLSLTSCFKRHQVNENALLQQQACIKSLEDENYKSAQVYCELCLEYDKTMPECLNGLGLVKWYHNDRQNALSFFSKALRQNNDFTEARNNIGVIHFAEQNYDEALKYFSRALAIDPGYNDARLNIALSHMRLAARALATKDNSTSLKRLSQAKEMLEKLIALDPTLDIGYQELGNVELQSYDQSGLLPNRGEMLKAAKSAYTTCIGLNNANDTCYQGLGQVFTELGDFDKAFANYFFCLSHEAKNSACKSGIALAFEKSAQAEGAYKNFVKSLKADPKNALGHEAFCMALFERGLDTEATKECQEALKLDPKICTPHFRLANHFAAMLNAEKATYHCRSFLACDINANNHERERCHEILASLRS